MRSALAAAAQRRAGRRSRSNSLNTVPPAQASGDYMPEYAAIAASVLYRSPLPSSSGLPVYIVSAAAFPDAFDVDYDALLPYVLARLPGEEELIGGQEYEVVFFAGGQPDSATSEKKQGPGIGWYLQAYHVLSRATRKKLQRLYIVHPRTWVRVLLGVFGTIVSPKFRRKIVHVNTLTGLALHLPIEKLLITPPIYLHDRKLSPDISAPYATGRRAFGARHPLPKNIDTGRTRLPRVLRETSTFLLLPQNVKTEGLFRISPSSTLADVLKEAYDRGQRFIVWKEKGATIVEPGMSQTLLDEVRLEDTYGVHLAAALIKTWYRELRDPIFHESSYDELRHRFSSADVKVSTEDLVDLFYPASPRSLLSATGREILTRHFLPLLSAVAVHEPQNKMNVGNLAICFAMALVCGSDQLEDAKMASIIRRILEPAIAIWPQLRDGMGIDKDAFTLDLQGPSDPRDYEDPLENAEPTEIARDDAVHSEEAHRIILSDAEESQPHPPRLPPRPPLLFPAQASIVSQSPSKEAVSAIPKRKPAPPSTEPPRYSQIFDADANSSLADSPTSYVQADGFGPPRSSNWSFAEAEKKGVSVPIPTPNVDSQSALVMPKRKAVSAEQTLEDSVPSAVTTSRSASGATSMLTRVAVQRAAEGLARRLAPLPPMANGNGPLRHEGSEEESPAQGEDIFRKPSWPASARPAGLAKPVLPTKESQIVPISFTQLTIPSSLPKPRAPSPALLRRMESMDSFKDAPAVEQERGVAELEPRKLNLKKASVDDLRRLYEERVSTAQSLARASATRRSSHNT